MTAWIRPRQVPWISASGWSVLAIDDVNALAEHVPAWDDLARSAIEPNSFHESWMLLPALRTFAGAAKMRVVLIFKPHPRDAHGTPTLCGLFPFEWLPSYKRLPASTMRFWSHPYGLLGTPLLRAGAARPCLEVLFEWLAADPRGAAVLELNQISADGPFYQELAGYLFDSKRKFLVTECWTRALFRRAADAETYLKAAMSSGQRREWRRKGRRLAEEGTLTYRFLQDPNELETWLAEFLHVEVSGWKGREGTAIACQPAHRVFFETTAREAFRRGTLQVFGLFLNERPLAYQCYFVAGRGSFNFKPAYDETYARYSPGTLLQLELIDRFHQQPGLDWMDSCSAPDGYLNALWPDRRIMQNVVIPTGKGMGGFAVSVVPLLRWLKEKLFGKRVPSHAAPAQGAGASSPETGQASTK